MEKIKFTNNVEFVREAKKILEDPSYEGGVDKERDICLYRLDADHSRRCVIGRLFYGYIPEENKFWCSESDIYDIYNSIEFGIREIFPWLDILVADQVQNNHDTKFLNTNKYSWDSWELIEKRAIKADQEYFGAMY